MYLLEIEKLDQTSVSSENIENSFKAIQYLLDL